MSSFVFSSIYYYIFLFLGWVSMMSVHDHSVICLWRSEDNTQNWFSSSTTDSRDQTLVIGLFRKCLITKPSCQSHVLSLQELYKICVVLFTFKQDLRYWANHIVRPT